MSQFLTAGRVLSRGLDVSPGWVSWQNGLITAVGAGPAPQRPEFAFPECTVIPGLVDVHAHGGSGHSFADGAAAAALAAAFHHASGTTSVMASLLTAPISELERSMADLAELTANGTILGVHLEGPWISRQHLGAHSAGSVVVAERDSVARVVTRGHDTLRIVTLAPEIGGAQAAIELLVGAGVIVSLGHTNATYLQARAAFSAGATAVTHLFNAMRPYDHREPGIVGAALEADDAFVELICDGIHLHPATIKLAFASLRHPVLVSDATAASGMGDGSFQLGELNVVSIDRVARVVGTEAIAGSTSTLSEVLRNVVRVAGIPLASAVDAATSTPAQMLGRSDIGVIAPGARADLVAMNSDLSVTRVLRKGIWMEHAHGETHP